MDHSKRPKPIRFRLIAYQLGNGYFDFEIL